MAETGHRISIIVPARGEAEGIGAFLQHLRERAPDAEVIVAVDAGEEDATAAIARRAGATVVLAPPPRAAALNAGAAAASGDVLWFLHADSTLPNGAPAAILHALEDSRLAGGCFRIRIARPALIYRITDTLGNLGVDLFRIALGDHGIFARREVFQACGGYPIVALMEDAEFYRRLRRHGQVRQLRRAIETSPRRFERRGPVRTTAVYLLILVLYVLRIPTGALAWIYRSVR